MKKLIVFLFSVLTIIAKDINVGFFNKVKIETSGQVYITQGDKNSLRVEGDSNILKYVIAKVSNDTLKLSLRDNVFISNGKRGSIKYYVELKNLNELESEGSADTFIESLIEDKLEVKIDSSGDFNLKNLQLKELKLKSEGSGNVILNGEIENISIKVTGSGDLNINSLINNSFNIKSEGSGDISINNFNNKSLIGKMEGSGDFFILGTGNSLNLEMTGSGDFKGKNYFIEDATVQMEGSGDCIVNASRYISINLFSSGDFYYYGGGYIRNIKVSGSGDVFKKY